LILAGLGFPKLSKDTLIKGYLGNDKKLDGSRIPETEIDYNKDTTALSLFGEYLLKAKSENIKVIFVYAPFHIRAMRKIKNVDKMFLMFDSIAKKYDIPILNYTYDSISYDTTYFYNAMHLNKKGAELFSAKLARDIDSLVILKNN
jgi:lysophospholipase L1-like esterase